MLDYEDFYYNLDFNIDQRVLGAFHMKQGDNLSRGFKVNVLQRGNLVNITNQSLRAFLVKPNGEDVTIEGRKDEGIFIIDIPVGVLGTVGRISGELILLGNNGEKISDYIFNITVEKSISYEMEGGE